MRVSIDPRTLRRGGRAANRVAIEAARSASRLRSLPMPEGAEDLAPGEINAAAADLLRAARSLNSQARWLAFRAQMAFLADAGEFTLVLIGPRLESPFADTGHRPGSGRAPGKDEGGLDDGVFDGLVDILDGAVRTVAVAGSKYLDPEGIHTGRLPYVGKDIARWRREFAEGMRWAKEHPGEFLKAFGKDLVAYNEHARGDHDYGFGKNAVEIAGVLVPVSKITKLAKAAKAAEAARASRARGRDVAQGAADDATTKQLRDQGRLGGHSRDVKRRDGETAQEFAERQRKKLEARAQARRDYEASRDAAKDARTRLDDAKADLDRARREAEQAAEEQRSGTRKEVIGEAVESTNTGTHQAHEQERERAGR